MRRESSSSRVAMSTTPLCACTFGPPSSSAVIFSPSTCLTTAGPVSPRNVPSHWIMNEPWRGRYEPPPALKPNINMMLGTTPLIFRNAVKAWL